MKRSLLILALALGANHLNAQHFTPVDEGSNVKFIIKNFGLNVTGEFKGLKGDISFDPDKLSSASFIASVDAATVNTGNGSRDRHLRKEEYLFVEKFPLIDFASTRISAISGKLVMEGRITIRGVTKNISFPFTAVQGTDDDHFEGEFRLNRRDFGVGGSSWVMSDELTVSLSVRAIKK